MNAILRELEEAPVLTLEQIEVHLSYMRTDVEAANAALPVLRDKIEALSDKVDSKFDQTNRDRATGDALLAEKIDQQTERLDRKIDQQSDRLDKRIDEANKDRAAGDALLAGKMDKLTETVLEMQGLQKGVLWLLTSVTLIASAASIARTLGWI